MSSNNDIKHIESCVKVFELIKLLLCGDATNSELIKLFEDNKQCSNTACVTLNKYINTLKIFGINIIKTNGHYKILNPPYKIDVSETELNGFYELYNFSKELNKNFESIAEFFKSIEARFSENIQINIKKEFSKNKSDFKFYYEQFIKKIEICTKFCSEDYRTEITYFKPGCKKECIIQAKPEKLLYNKNKIKLYVLNLSNRETLSIDINKIISIRQLSNKITSNYRFNKTIIFQLSNRLAENYTPRKWEYLDNFDDKGNKIFINKDEDENELLHRILKYKTYCKILSPQSFKDKLLDEIDRTLQLYEQ